MTFNVLTDRGDLTVSYETCAVHRFYEQFALSSSTYTTIRFMMVGKTFKTRWAVNVLIKIFFLNYESTIVINFFKLYRVSHSYHPQIQDQILRVFKRAVAYDDSSLTFKIRCHTIGVHFKFLTCPKNPFEGGGHNSQRCENLL